MRSIVSYPGNMQHAQQIARALHENGWLAAYVTSFCYRSGGPADNIIARLPWGPARKVRTQLQRRCIDEVPGELVHSYPFWEVLRSGALKGRAGPVIVDRLWDRMSQRFDDFVARRYVRGCQAIHAFEYTALATFQRAGTEHVARILHLASLSSRSFEEIRKRESAGLKECEDPNAAYFAGKFPQRQARRDAEIALADLIIANSTLTAQSHIAQGADPAKVVVVPLGAPPVLAQARPARGGVRSSLNVVYAGHFTLGKGALYLLDAWRRLGAKGMARLDVYGEVHIPQRLLAQADDSIVFHGVVSRSELFGAYDDADVLVFPSLSDGFGMVVAEAMANGLPVITTNMVGAAADLVTPKNGLIIPAADANALTQALLWCLDNRQVLEEMRVEALASARQHQWPNYRLTLIERIGLGLAGAGASSHRQYIAANKVAR